MSDVPEGYRMREVGVIPEEWEEERLGKECELITKGTTPTSLGKGFKDDGINFIKIESLEENGTIIKEKVAFIDEETHKLLKRSQLKENDVLVSIAGALGRIAIVKAEILPANTNQALAIVRLKPQTKLNRNYLFYFLNSTGIKKHIDAINVQAAQANLSLENINDFTIFIPPLPEQQAIAAALSDVDALITALEQLITKKRNIKQGAMQQLITGEKRLPGFGGVWEVKKLEGVSEIIMGQSPAGNSYNQNAIGIALINGPTEFTEKYPIKIQWTSLPTKLCKEGDILLCIRGSSTGRMNISNDGYCIGRGIAAIRAKENSDGSFLEFQVQNAVKNILALTTGSTFPNIDGKSLKNIEVVRPPLPEQQAIAQILSDMDTEIEALKQKRDKYKAIKQGMMQELLTGKTRLVKEDKT